MRLFRRWMKNSMDKVSIAVMRKIRGLSNTTPWMFSNLTATVVRLAMNLYAHLREMLSTACTPRTAPIVDTLGFER